MITIEIYKNGEEPLIQLDFLVMIRVGEQLSILKDEYYVYYIVKKIWYRIDDSSKECVPCAEVMVDD
jgi:hypothetical protein